MRKLFLALCILYMIPVVLHAQQHLLSGKYTEAQLAKNTQNSGWTGYAPIDSP